MNDEDPIQRRWVTREEFDQITCNRCGACCEVVWQPSPMNMALLIGRNAVLPDYLTWWSDLEPIVDPKDHDGNSGNLQRYRCLRFSRDEAGTGHCSHYETRPSACATFPDGMPVRARGFEACSWNVSIIGEDD